MNIFKKIIYLSFLLGLVFLAGCGSNGPAGETAAKADAKNTQSLKASDSVYTIAVMSDTQKYAKGAPETYRAMIKYLADNRDYLNLAYVVHTGDLVHEPDSKSEWQTASDALALLDGKVPYGVLAGNHDQGNGDDKYTNFTAHFGTSKFEKLPGYGASLAGGLAMSQLVTVGSKDFIFVYLCDDPDMSLVEFANSQFAAYPDRIGVLCTHKYLAYDGSVRLSQDGETLRELIVEKNPNVYMVLCGHESLTGYREDKIDSSRTVLEIISNYQESGDTAGSMLFLQVHENSGKINAVTYSPVAGSFTGHADKRITDEFTVKIPW